MSQLFEKARIFIYRNARFLDLTRFRYHFENGPKDDVLRGLSFYQNIDGGFGYGLEAGSFNPNSTPMQIQKAIKILSEIDFTQKEHPIIKGVLNFLENDKFFDGHFWHAGVEGYNNYNPTAALAGFLVRFADQGSRLYEIGCRIVREAYENLVFENQKDDMRTTYCYIQMLDYLKKAKETNLIDLLVLEVRLREIVNRSITQDREEWKCGYVCRPSYFFNSRDSIFYKDNKEIADYECEFIRNTQLKDGSYMVYQDWASCPENWAVNSMWQKSEMIISNMLYLKKMGF